MVLSGASSRLLWLSLCTRTKPGATMWRSVKQIFSKSRSNGPTQQMYVEGHDVNSEPAEQSPLRYRKKIEARKTKTRPIVSAIAFILSRCAYEGKGLCACRSAAASCRRLYKNEKSRLVVNHSSGGQQLVMFDC